MKVLEKTGDQVVNLALDTIDKRKQALVFVNSKRSAEKVAEDIGKKTGMKQVALTELAQRILDVLSKPTKQCERLAKCVEGGVAFHHSGLAPNQRELVEDAFGEGIIKIIGCTPTLAAGLDMPAFRSIIRDVKRFGQHGMQHIPVLEFLQMAGRAGRPKYDKVGEVIVVTQSEGDQDYVAEHYLRGDPEDILSKLAVEPVLRMYLLSLINSRIIGSKESIMDFFTRTFWAFQYKDIPRMEKIIDRVLKMLVDWAFLQETDDGFRATLIGKRVAELYVDPLTAHDFIDALEKSPNKKLKAFTWLQLACNTLEMRPLLRVKQKDVDEINQKYALLEPNLLQHEPSMFEPEYDDFMNSVKTAMMLEDWIEEKDEEWLLEKFDSRPGEVRVKIDNAEWLLYAVHELAVLKQMQPLLKEIMKVRLRLKYGVKEELLPLIKLEGIGRMRARKLHRAGLKDLGDIRSVQISKLTELVGEKLAKSLKRQVGAGVSESEGQATL